jgi:hypothetical protein
MLRLFQIDEQLQNMSKANFPIPKGNDQLLSTLNYPTRHQVNRQVHQSMLRGVNHDWKNFSNQAIDEQLVRFGNCHNNWV